MDATLNIHPLNVVFRIKQRREMEQEAVAGRYRQRNAFIAD
jgi:hypothetical protein